MWLNLNLQRCSVVWKIRKRGIFYTTGGQLSRALNQSQTRTRCCYSSGRRLPEIKQKVIQCKKEGMLGLKWKVNVKTYCLRVGFSLNARQKYLGRSIPSALPVVSRTPFSDQKNSMPSVESQNNRMLNYYTYKRNLAFWTVDCWMNNDTCQCFEDVNINSQITIFPHA